MDHDLTSITSLVYGFIGNSIISRGKITIVVDMVSPAQIAGHFTKFLVIDNRSTYHGVLGRPILKDLWTVTFVVHLCMKFPTERNITIVRGDQMKNKECYINSLWKAEHFNVNMVLIDIEIINALAEDQSPK